MKRWDVWVLATCTLRCTVEADDVEEAVKRARLAPVASGRADALSDGGEWVVVGQDRIGDPATLDVTDEDGRTVSLGTLDAAWAVWIREWKRERGQL